MKRVTFLLILAMFSFTFHTTNAHAKLTESENKFIQTITNDFIDTHSINFNGYNFFDMREISPTKKENLTIQEQSLSKIFMSIANEQNFIDCSPLIYIDSTNKKGYVLEKKLDGMNSLHILSYDNTKQSWKVTNETNKMGKDLVELGLLKGAE